MTTNDEQRTNGNIPVRVTQADIDQATVNNSSRCVVATAIARSIPDATRVSVDVQAIRFTSGGKRHTFLTPPTVAGYVVAFDAGEELRPFRFVLRSDQHMVVRPKKPPLTPAGRTTDRTKSKVRNAKKAVERAEARADALKSAGASPSEVKRAEAKVAEKLEVVNEAEDKRAAVMAAYSGQPKYEPADKSLPMTTPQVFKRNERVYGMRLLRINQAR
jgi:hypothetical protein